jgi:hypothetical protein
MMESFIRKAAARDDVRELVRLAWAYGGTDNEADVAMELEALATRLRAGGKWHDLAYMLNLPANRGIATVVSAVVDQLIAGGADVGPPVVQVARPGSREAKLRAIRVLDGIGEPRLAAELRSRLQDRLVTIAPVTQPWSQGPPPGYAGSSPPGYPGAFFVASAGAPVDREYTAPYAPHGYPARVAMPYPVGPVAGYPVHPQVQYPAGLSGARPSAGNGPVAVFIVSLVSLVVLPLVASFSWGTWSTSGGAAFGVRYPHELIVALVCLVVAIPGPIIYWRVFRRSRGFSGHGLATAALIIGILCFLRLAFNLGIEWAVLPTVLSPGLTPIGPF